jgi:protein-S-isoprenylcysteine O-methyltransferase Ste14
MLLPTALFFTMDRRLPLRLQPGWPTLASALVWAAFAIYWKIASRNASKAQQAESNGSRGVHVVFTTAAQLLLFLQPAYLAQRLIPIPMAGVAAGLALELAGVALAVRARVALGKHWSGRITIKVEHELIRTGPYRRMRHPIYTALLMLYLGAALISGETHAAIGFVLVVIAYMRKVRLEEAKLVEAFGEGYQEYQMAAWGLFPGMH